MIRPLKYTQTTNIAAAKAVTDLIDATLVVGGVIVPSVSLVVIQAETQSVRWVDDGSIPTASVGNVVPAGQTMVVYRDQFSGFKLIQSAANGIVNVTAYGGSGPAFVTPGPGGGSVSGTVAVSTVSGTVTTGGTQGSLTDRSGTVTTGGTAQQVMAANAGRKYLLVQNVSDTVCWINFGVTAVADQPSIKLNPGDSFVMEGGFVSTQLVSLLGATTGKSFTAKEG